ncbi:homeodomain-like protein [Tanacetum coccineum]
MPLSTYFNLGLGELAHIKLTVELADRTVKHPKGIAENVLVWIGKFVFPIDFIILDMLEDINVLLILGRPFLSTAHAKIDVFKRKITLRPLELRRNQVDDLEPTIEEGEVVNEPMMNIVKTRYDFISGLDDYPSNCNFDWKIHIDCAYNLKFSCMIGFEYVHANFLPILPINVMYKRFYNSIMKDKIEFKQRNKLENFVNAPVFIGNFYVINDFTVVEDMGPYLDEGIEDVIVGEPFCKASCVEARRFDGIITIRDGDDSVTYQMVWSNPKFKHLTNDKCNKIPPLLKVSEQDKMNGISGQKGVEYLAADHLSRLENLDLRVFTEEEITNKFPDEHLMILKAKPIEDEPWLCPDNIMRRYVTGSEILEILAHFHSGPTGGHHSASVTGRKIGKHIIKERDASKQYSGKLKSKWYGLNVAKTVYPYGTVEIIDKNRIRFKVNGQRLKKYYNEHINKEDNEVVEFEEDTT